MGSHVGYRRIRKIAMNPLCDKEYQYDTLLEKSVSNKMENCFSLAFHALFHNAQLTSFKITMKQN